MGRRGMSAVVKINGREAIPVRAIPYVTGWDLSPDVVAQCLAQVSDWPSHPQGMIAYHVMRDGRIAEMLPKEWDGVVTELQSLSDTLHAEEVVAQGSYPEWCKQSIRVLPSHCFVWLDTLEAACSIAWSRLTIMNERPGDKELTLTPRIPPKLVEVVFEGFPAATVTPESIQVTDVQLTEIDLQAQRRAEPDSCVATWQDQIREVADELHRNDLLAGAWSSDKDMSERLAAEAIKRKIRGPRGQLTAGNILREALQGGRWKRPEN